MKVFTPIAPRTPYKEITLELTFETFEEAYAARAVLGGVTVGTAIYRSCAPDAHEGAAQRFITRTAQALRDALEAQAYSVCSS